MTINIEVIAARRGPAGTAAECVQTLIPFHFWVPKSSTRPKIMTLLRAAGWRLLMWLRQASVTLVYCAGQRQGDTFRRPHCKLHIISRGVSLKEIGLS